LTPVAQAEGNENSDNVAEFQASMLPDPAISCHLPYGPGLPGARRVAHLRVPHRGMAAW